MLVAFGRYERRLWIGRLCVMQESGCGKYEDLARKYAEKIETSDEARRLHGGRWEGAEIARATNGENGGSCVGGLLCGRRWSTREHHAWDARGGASRRREGRAHETLLRRRGQGAREEARRSRFGAESGA